MPRERALKRRTARRFGYLWDREAAEAPPASFHYRLLRDRLPAGHLRGRVLDAGCGAGIDTLHLAEAHADGQIVGVELSWPGASQASARTRHLAHAHVLQGDVERLPFSDRVFDFVYSYGVLHHVPSPEQGFRELVRVLKPEGVVAVYVYEDFQSRTAAERLALRAVNTLRHVTTRLPARALYALCWLASPLAYLGLTLPARAMARVAWLAPASRRIPFHHGTGPLSLVGDLFDRFSAPIERRYNPDDLAGWCARAGLEDVRVVPHRGWLAIGRKPARQLVSQACAESAAS